MTALPDRSYTTDRHAARQSRKGTTLYPALLPLDTHGIRWARQDYAGGPLVVLNPIPDPQVDGLVIVAA